MVDISKSTALMVSLYPADRLYPLSAPLSPPSSLMYNIKEDLFERDEDHSQDNGNEVPFDTAYHSYTPCRQPVLFPLNLNAMAEDEDDDDEDQIYFPSYDEVECSDQVECMEPPIESALAEQRPVSPCPVERPEDDSAIRAQPSRQVDYFSHDWSEEDLSSTWRYIVSKRREYSNSARLENASWRCWGKKRSNLRTVSPESVKWLKDYDLTWLYGPLTPGSCSFDESCPSRNCQSRGKIACLNKKPILKKRSLSEIMLRRSISSSLLLKQAAVAKFGNESTPASFPFESPGLTRSNTGSLPSASESGLGTPAGWKKVQFYELVEQCIVVNIGDNDHEYHYCSESDDDVVMLRKSTKRATSKWLPTIPEKQNRPSETIVKLPNARLKCPEELEEVLAESISDEFCTSRSPSPTPLDLLPRSFDLTVSGEESDDEGDMNWQLPGWRRGRKDSVHIAKDRISGEAVLEACHTRRPHLERRNAMKEQEDVLHAPLPPAVEGMDASINFELPRRSQLAVFPLGAPSKALRMEDDYFMVDPGMTEDEFEDSSDMSQSSSEHLDHNDESGIKLDPIKTALVDRVMEEFWNIFNQRWDTYVDKSEIASPPPPRPNPTPYPYPSARKRRRSGDKKLSHRSGQQRRTSEKSNSFDNTPGTPLSPDSKELADYQSFIHRELPRAVLFHLKELIRLDNNPSEFSLMSNLVSIIRDCQDKVFQSYVKTTDRDDRAQGLGITSIDPFQASRLSTGTGHHSELLDAAYQPPPSKYAAGRNYHTPLRDSTLSVAGQSSPLATPGLFSDSGYATEIPSSITRPHPTKHDIESYKYPLPKDLRERVALAEKDWDWEIYGEVDEAHFLSNAY